METSVMIRQLRYTAKKHENDTLHTFDTNISAMCTDVANRLEELEKEKEEIRVKAIEEFTEKLKSERVYVDVTSDDMIYGKYCTYIDGIAKEMKGERYHAID